MSASETTRKPPWARSAVPSGKAVRELRETLRGLRLHTVCESARCPNIAECWSERAATIMILGDVCTRSCGFCAVKTGKPGRLDDLEPIRTAEAIARMGLKHAVITSVNRDDLPDGGSGAFARTILAVRKRNPGCSIEALIPDFRGDWEALRAVLEARPDILNHNIETVPRLYRLVRPQAKYARSLELLKRAKRAGMVVKSGMMVGLGETFDEVRQTMEDLSRCGADIVTVGQYMQPDRERLPVVRYLHPDEFEAIREAGLALGLRHVESGVWVRSSYRAKEQVSRAFGG